MALRLVDVIEAMKAVIAAGDAHKPVERSDKILQLAADFLESAIGRDRERGQTAILLLAPDLQQLIFAYPRHLAQGNMLPVDRNSVAGRVLQTRSLVIENNLPNEPHKDIFERIPNEAGKVRPIQKMIAAPLLDREGAAFGVVEVSRTGATLAEAGPDFTPQDGQNLQKCCQAFAPYIGRTWTRERGW